MMFATGKFIKDPEAFDMKGWGARTDAYVAEIEKMPESRWISLLANVRATIEIKAKETRRRRGPSPEEVDNNLEMPSSDPPSDTAM